MSTDSEMSRQEREQLLAEAEATIAEFERLAQGRPSPERPELGADVSTDAARAVRAIMMLMHEGAAMLDAEGRVLACNARLAEMLRHAPGDLVGRPFAAFIHPSDEENWQTAFSRGAVAAPLGFTLQILVDDDRPIPVHVTVCSLAEPLGRIAFLVASDVAWQDERIRQLQRINRQLEEQRDSLELAATTDSATGAYTSAAVFEVLETELAYGSRYGYPVSLLIMDLDHFKSFNDTYGHAFGDEILKEFCDRCRRAVRNTDYLVRYGGDEFVVILPQTDDDGVRAASERIMGAVRGAPFGEGSHEVAVTVSVGAATATPEDKVTAATLVQRADIALYAVKHRGRDGMALWTEDMPTSYVPD